MDKAVLGSCRLGYFRLGVCNHEFDKLLTHFKKAFSSFDVTRRALALGDADTITGWYGKSYVESTAEMVIIPKGMRSLALAAGVYPHYEVTGFHLDPVAEGDEVKDAAGNYYTVELTQPNYVGDNLAYYESSLTKLPLHFDMPTTYGTGATVEDPRHRTKDYLDAYLFLGGILPLENDGVTVANFHVQWANPPYPVKTVFVTKNIDLNYSIARGPSKPLIGGDKCPYNYKEKLSIFVQAIDKTTISGDNLMWQGEAELRHVTEDHPQGSLRFLETMTPTTQSLGSLTLYSVECVLDYTRALT